MAAPDAPAASPGKTSAVGLILMVFLVAGAGTLGAVSLAWYATDGFGVNGRAQVEEVAAEAPVVPVEEPAVEPATEAAEEPPPEPVVAEPEPLAQPKAAPRPRPRPKPRPVAVASGTVAVAGDAESVALIDAAGNRFPAGTVTVGTYTIEATFSGRGAVQAGTVDVKSGQTATITCRGMFGRCDVSL